MLAIVVGVIAVDVRHRRAAAVQLGTRLLADGRRPVRRHRQPRVRAAVGRARCSSPASSPRASAAAAAPSIAIALWRSRSSSTAHPFFGADVGGVLSMVPAYAAHRDDAAGLAGALAFGRALRRRRGRGDRAVRGVRRQPARGQQTHLGRLVHTTTDGGWDAFATVIQRKIDANSTCSFRSTWTVMLPIVLHRRAATSCTARPGGMRPLVDRVPQLRAALAGLDRARASRLRAERLRDRDSRHDARRRQRRCSSCSPCGATALLTGDEHLDRRDRARSASWSARERRPRVRRRRARGAVPAPRRPRHPRVAGARDARTIGTRPLPTAAGLFAVLAVLTVEAGRSTLGAFGLGDEPGTNPARALVLFACLGFGLLGFVDDVLGTGDDRGFRGHLRALRAGPGHDRAVQDHRRRRGCVRARVAGRLRDRQAVARRRGAHRARGEPRQPARPRARPRRSRSARGVDPDRARWPGPAPSVSRSRR